MEPLVSVVIPTYNRAYCLPETISSVLSQTYQNIEIVVVDDGSTDRTSELFAERYANVDRIKYIQQPNRGVSAARNTALKQANGEFVAFCDSDDIWLPWKIRAQVSCMQAFPAAGLSWTDLSAVDNSGRVLHARYTRTCYETWSFFALEELFSSARRLSEIDLLLPAEIVTESAYCGDIFSKMVVGTIINMPTVMARRLHIEKAGLFDETMVAGEDYDFNLRLTEIAPAVFIDAASVRYRVGAPDQLTRPALLIEQARNSLRTLVPYIRQKRSRIQLTDKLLSQVLAKKYRWLGQTEFDAGLYRSSRSNFLQSLFHQPAQPKLFTLAAMALLPPRMIALLLQGYRALKSCVRSS